MVEQYTKKKKNKENVTVSSLRNLHRRQSVGDGGVPQYFAGGDGPPNNFCLRIFDTLTILGLIIQANA